ncbi:hypothetical protein [Streptococcus salivarius]|uniref:hypothetical protein n=1 Tax=Streptococcus salivarius TaxID=1304 RepID=UPI001F3E1DB7|nr:hypothetical protein [Streptococcus salivarius]
MGFKSHISWNALSYLEDKAKITITHNQADLKDEKKDAVLLAGYLKKSIELVTSPTSHITDIFLFDEQAQMDTNTLSQLLSKVPYVHYLSTEHFFHSPHINNFPKNRPFIFNTQLFRDTRNIYFANSLVEGHDPLFESLAKNDITQQSFFGSNNYIYIPGHNGKEEARAKVIMNVTKIEDLTVESIKPLEPVSATAEPQQSMKELRLDEIEERLKQKVKSLDTIKHNEKSSEVLKITSETLTMIRKVMDCIGRMEDSLNAKMAEKADDNNKLDSDFDPLYAFRAQHDKLGED